MPSSLSSSKCRGNDCRLSLCNDGSISFQSSVRARERERPEENKACAPATKKCSARARATEPCYSSSTVLPQATTRYNGSLRYRLLGNSARREAVRPSFLALPSPLTSRPSTELNERVRSRWARPCSVRQRLYPSLRTCPSSLLRPLRSPPISPRRSPAGTLRGCCRRTSVAACGRRRGSTLLRRSCTRRLSRWRRRWTRTL